MISGEKAGNSGLSGLFICKIHHFSWVLLTLLDTLMTCA